MNGAERVLVSVLNEVAALLEKVAERPEVRDYAAGDEIDLAILHIRAAVTDLEDGANDHE